MYSSHTFICFEPLVTCQQTLQKNNNTFIIFQSYAIVNETVFAMTQCIAIIKPKTTNILCLCQQEKKHESFFLKFKNVILILSHVNLTFLQIGPSLGISLDLGFPSHAPIRINPSVCVQAVLYFYEEPPVQAFKKKIQNNLDSGLHM